eukprot:NODE_41_length_29768_cov_0.533924.p12 type:complete len:250 gc:universal NODE_41_length_29768_cov_0.533924:24125-23376(-)
MLFLNSLVLSFPVTKKKAKTAAILASLATTSGFVLPLQMSSRSSGQVPDPFHQKPHLVGGHAFRAYLDGYTSEDEARKQGIYYDGKKPLVQPFEIQDVNAINDGLKKIGLISKYNEGFYDENGKLLSDKIEAHRKEVASTGNGISPEEWQLILDEEEANYQQQLKKDLDDKINNIANCLIEKIRKLVEHIQDFKIEDVKIVVANFFGLSGTKDYMNQIKLNPDQVAIIQRMLKKEQSTSLSEVDDNTCI